MSHARFDPRTSWIMGWHYNTVAPPTQVVRQFIGIRTHLGHGAIVGTVPFYSKK
jgi:hypothetical protein